MGGVPKRRGAHKRHSREGVRARAGHTWVGGQAVVQELEGRTGVLTWGTDRQCRGEAGHACPARPGTCTKVISMWLCFPSHILLRAAHFLRTRGWWTWPSEPRTHRHRRGRVGPCCPGQPPAGGSPPQAGRAPPPPWSLHLSAAGWGWALRRGRVCSRGGLVLCAEGRWGLRLRLPRLRLCRRVHSRAFSRGVQGSLTHTPAWQGDACASRLWHVCTRVCVIVPECVHVFARRVCAWNARARGCACPSACACLHRGGRGGGGLCVCVCVRGAHTCVFSTSVSGVQACGCACGPAPAVPGPPVRGRTVPAMAARLAVLLCPFLAGGLCRAPAVPESPTRVASAGLHVRGGADAGGGCGPGTHPHRAARGRGSPRRRLRVLPRVGVQIGKWRPKRVFPTVEASGLPGPRGAAALPGAWGEVALHG